MDRAFCFPSTDEGWTARNFVDKTELSKNLRAGSGDLRGREEGDEVHTSCLSTGRRIVFRQDERLPRRHGSPKNHPQRPEYLITWDPARVRQSGPNFVLGSRENRTPGKRRGHTQSKEGRWKRM